MSNTPTLPKVCAECGKRTNKVNRSDQNPELCKTCFHQAELELNDDFDQEHCRHCDVALNEENTSEAFTDVCKKCDEEVPSDGPGPSFHGTADAPTKQAHFDHSACDHPKTAKDRAQCRKTGRAAVFHGVISELPAQDDSDD